MPMTKVLEQAFREAERLPEEDQQIIADFIVHFIHPDEKEEAEWDALVATPESQAFLDKMVRELKEEEEKQGLLPFPSGK